MVFREEQEKREYEMLSAFACKSAESRGRAVPEKPGDLRTEFQRPHHPQQIPAPLNA